jgi:hypothetical protein
MKGTWIKYPVDIKNPNQKRLKELIEWCDVLNIHDDGDLLIPKGSPGRPIVQTYHGTYYRKQWKQLNRRDKRLGYKPTVLTLDLARFGPIWIPRPIHSLAQFWAPDEQFRVCQAPSKRAKKGTDLVVKAAKGLPIKLDIIERMSNYECLHRKFKAHVLIDQVGPVAYGYGTNAIEAWSIGMPVISDGPDDVLQMMRDTFDGELPFIQARTVQDIRRAILRLKNDTDYYQEWKERGQRYVTTLLAQSHSGLEYVKLCQSF